MHKYARLVSLCQQRIPKKRPKKRTGTNNLLLMSHILNSFATFLIFYRQIIGISVCRKRAILRFEEGRMTRTSKNNFIISYIYRVCL